MSKQSHTTGARFVALVASLPVFWILVFLGTYFLMAFGASALALGPVNEAVYPTLITMALVIASVAIIGCLYNEMRGGGLQNPITALKNIGRFALATVALPVLWFGAIFVTFLALAIFAVLFGFVDLATLESDPESTATLLSISVMIGAVIVGAGIVYQWKHKKKGLLMAIIGSTMLLMSMFTS